MRFIKTVSVLFAFALMCLVSSHASAADDLAPWQKLLNSAGGALADETLKEASSNPPPVQGGSFFDNIQNAAGQLAKRFNAEVLTALKSAGLSFAGGLIAPALALGGSLALCYLLYEVIVFLGSKDTSILNLLFDVGVPCMIAALLITNYAQNIAMIDEVFAKFREVGGNPTNSVMQFYSTVLTMIGAAIKAAFNNLTTASLITSIGSILMLLVDAVVTMLFVFIILAIVLSSMAEILGLLLLGPFLYAVGIAFGPLMLAGLVTPWTRQYTGAWIGFIFAANVLAGVLGVAISIAIKVFEILGFSEYASGQSTSMTLAVVAILLLAVNSLINQAPSIASALVPGSIGARSAQGAASAQQVGRNAVKPGRTAANSVKASMRVVKSVRAAKP